MYPCFAPFDRLYDTVLDKRYVYALSRLHSQDQAGIPHCGVLYTLMLTLGRLLRLKARRKPEARLDFMLEIRLTPTPIPAILNSLIQI